MTIFFNRQNTKKITCTTEILSTIPFTSHLVMKPREMQAPFRVMYVYASL